RTESLTSLRKTMPVSADCMLVKPASPFGTTSSRHRYPCSTCHAGVGGSRRHAASVRSTSIETTEDTEDTEERIAVLCVLRVLCGSTNSIATESPQHFRSHAPA